jgi:hypothetical protein
VLAVSHRSEDENEKNSAMYQEDSCFIRLYIGINALPALNAHSPPLHT